MDGETQFLSLILDLFFVLHFDQEVVSSNYKKDTTLTIIQDVIESSSRVQCRNYEREILDLLQVSEYKTQWNQRMQRNQVESTDGLIKSKVFYSQEMIPVMCYMVYSGSY